MVFMSVKTIDDFDEERCSERIEQFTGMRWADDRLIVLFTQNESVVCHSTKGHYDVLQKSIKESIAHGYEMLDISGTWGLMLDEDWDKYYEKKLTKAEEHFFDVNQYPILV